jgi:ABC-2 type transport system ATP-binding protein
MSPEESRGPRVGARVNRPQLASVHGASKRFGELLAVDDVHLRVVAGEVVGLIGANGAGKTTLIRMLLGLLAPTAGHVQLFGEPPSRRTRARLGYVPQSLGLYEDLTVAENLAFSAAAYGRHEPGALTGELAEARDVLVRDLPVGLRRRAAFAIALAHQPDLLVLDEPTSGVDPLQRARLWETIRASAEQGAGVLVTTHHLREAEQCDRLVVLASGRVAAAGSLAEVVGDTTAVEVRTPSWEAAFTALDAAGLPVSLVGRTLRVPGADPGAVGRLLADADVPADVAVVPASFEETFVVLAADRPAVPRPGRSPASARVTPA